MLLTTLFLISCNNQQEDGTIPISDNAETTTIDNELTEFGDGEIEDSQEPESEFITEVCDIFQDNTNGVGELLEGIFRGKANKCDRLNEKVSHALFMAHSFATDLTTKLDGIEHTVCHGLTKRAVRKAYQIIRREQNVQRKPEIATILELRNQLEKERLSRILRKMHKNECSKNLIVSIVAVHQDATKLFEPDENFILNGSFELFKNPSDDIKGTSTLEDSWTIVESSNIPGWRVSDVSNENENKKCNYLEIQKAGTVTSAPHGNQLIELDGHCTNSQGHKVSGEAHVEISQRFPVNEKGTYRLRLLAQKRGGKYGDLEVSVFQRKKDKEFTHYEIPSVSQWYEVCHEINIEDIKRNITVTIKDNNSDGKNTYGLLVDRVIFEQGACK